MRPISPSCAAAAAGLIVSRADGQQVFIFSRRLEREGRFAGVAVISFDVRLFEDIWESLDLDDKSTVSIVRNDGQLVARFPRHVVSCTLWSGVRRCACSVPAHALRFGGWS